jgi:hypothetical protein
VTLPRDGHFIATTDGGADWLQPGRWIARLWIGFRPATRSPSVHGVTEQSAVDILKDSLRTQWPNILWYQGLPVVREDEAWTQIQGS